VETPRPSPRTNRTRRVTHGAALSKRCGGYGMRRGATNGPARTRSVLAEPYAIKRRPSSGEFAPARHTLRPPHCPRPGSARGHGPSFQSNVPNRFIRTGNTRCCPSLQTHQIQADGNTPVVQSLACTPDGTGGWACERTPGASSRPVTLSAVSSCPYTKRVSRKTDRAAPSEARVALFAATRHSA